MSDPVDVLLTELKAVNSLSLPTSESDILTSEKILSMTQSDLAEVESPINGAIHSMSVGGSLQIVQRAVDAARKALITKNNGVIPAVAGKLRKEGFSVITYKCNEAPGNIAVLIGTKKGFIEVADDFHWTKILRNALNWPIDVDAEPAPKSIWSKLFG